MNTKHARTLLSALLPLALVACGGAQKKTDDMAGMEGMEKGEGAEKKADKDAVTLSARQISDAGIEVSRPAVGGIAGAVELPALVQGDPQGVQVVSATIGGRLVALTRNLGQSVRRGDPIAVIESREAASLKAEVEAARARAGLAQSNLRREQRLFAERVSPEQDLVAARTAAAEANIALRLAQQQLGATGGGGGALNRIAMRSPISGQVIARPAVLGQTVDANAELYRVVNLSRVTIAASVSPADAGRIRPGTRVEVTAAGRRQEGHVSFVSPALDESTRLVRHARQCRQHLARRRASHGELPAACQRRSQRLGTIDSGAKRREPHGRLRAHSYRLPRGAGYDGSPQRRSGHHQLGPDRPGAHRHHELVHPESRTRQGWRDGHGLSP
jgi:membrane fusion protein, heavy metal efflux system